MKPENKALLRKRAEAALSSLYHNATPAYPRDLYGRSEEVFQSWFEEAAQSEIEYIQDGGAYGSNYLGTLAAPCNAGKYKSRAAQQYYIRKGMRDMQAERFDCGAVTGWRWLELAVLRAQKREVPPYSPPRNNSLWERITEYGELYQWGRGGRTLAPADLIRQRGGSGFSIRADYVEEISIDRLIEFIVIVESFNRYVAAWCKGVPEMWREYCEDEDAEKRAAKQAAAVRKDKETRERRYWAERDVQTVCMP